MIREMNPDDWPSVRRIYLEGIATSMATFETGGPGLRRVEREAPSAFAIRGGGGRGGRRLGGADPGFRTAGLPRRRRADALRRRDPPAARNRGERCWMRSSNPRQGTGSGPCSRWCSRRTRRRCACTRAAASAPWGDASASVDCTVSGRTRSCWSGGGPDPRA